MSAICLLLLVSCTTEETIGDPPDVPTLPQATTPDQLMANFKTVYETMDCDCFRDLLMHPDYQTRLQQDTVDEFSLPESFFTYADGLTIQAHLFSGQPIATPGGVLPGISSIDFTTFEQQFAWTRSAPDDPNFPDTLYSSYNVKVEFMRAGGAATTLIVQGIIQVYVTTIEQNGANFYRLIGMVDLTDSKTRAAEGCCFGAVKALYR